MVAVADNKADVENGAVVVIVVVVGGGGGGGGGGGYLIIELRICVASYA